MWLRVSLTIGTLLYFWVSNQQISYCDDSWVKPPTKCEVCKYLAVEFSSKLKEVRSKEVLQTGHGLETKKKRFAYDTSELRLIEVMNEPHVCERLLDYNVHNEKKNSLRFAKKKSQTMQTLQGLVNRGVNVTMDVPYDLWNETSAEVRDLHKQCFMIVNDYEDDLEEWYYHHQDKDLMDYLCRERVLKNAKADDACLSEKEDDKEIEQEDDGQNEAPEKDKSKVKAKKDSKEKKSKAKKTKEKKKDEL